MTDKAQGIVQRIEGAVRQAQGPQPIRRVALSADLKAELMALPWGTAPSWMLTPENLAATEPGPGRIRIVFADLVLRIDGGMEGPADRPLDRAVQNALPRSRLEKLHDKRRRENGLGSLLTGRKR